MTSESDVARQIAGAMVTRTPDSVRADVNDGHSRTTFLQVNPSSGAAALVTNPSILTYDV